MDNFLLAQRIGQRIQQKRIGRNLTQEAVAELLDAATTTVSRWETGVTIPSIRYQKRLCEILRTEYKELFGDLQQASQPTPDEPTLPFHAFNREAGQAPAEMMPQPLIEFQISIPVSVVSAKELLQQLQKSVKINGKKQMQDVHIGENNGDITITARLYPPVSSPAPQVTPSQGRPTNESLYLLKKRGEL